MTSGVAHSVEGIALCRFALAVYGEYERPSDRSNLRTWVRREVHILFSCGHLHHNQHSAQRAVLAFQPVMITSPSPGTKQGSPPFSERSREQSAPGSPLPFSEAKCMFLGNFGPMRGKSGLMLSV